MSEAMFESVGQALYVSYLMEILPVYPTSIMQVIYDDQNKRNQIWDDVKKDRTINFIGLSALEVRGQCALIRRAVDRNLDVHEIAVIKSYYGHQKTKSDGVRGFVEYLTWLLPIKNKDAILALGWSVFVTRKQRDGLSIAAISKEYGLDRRLARDAQMRIINDGQLLFSRAMNKLRPEFEISGIV